MNKWIDKLNNNRITKNILTDELDKLNDLLD